MTQFFIWAIVCAIILLINYNSSDNKTVTMGVWYYLISWSVVYALICYVPTVPWLPAIW